MRPMLKRTIVGCALIAALAVPAAAQGVLSPSDYKNASKFCKALRDDMGTTLFRQTYGTNKNRSNAHGKCVSKHAQTVDDVHAFAVNACRTERDTLGEEAFANKYGTNKNKSNAFGKCVSQQAKQQTEEVQDDIVNAARACRAERNDLGVTAFRNKYGTNRNKRNAFGKCVSQHARADEPGGTT
jgi:hypothetical protein